VSTDREKIKHSFYDLEQQLGIKIWQDSLTLPDSDSTHSEQEFHREQTLGFTFFRDFKEPGRVAVFISDKTQYLQLFRFLPFWFHHFELFLCPQQLILNRLAILAKDEDFKVHNQATQQLQFILNYAIKSRASDIHLECLAKMRRVRIRVDGDLKLLEMREEIGDNLITKIKLISGMDIAKNRLPQDGHFPFLSVDGKRYDLRTSTIPSVNGEKMVIRLLPAIKVNFTMDGMGFPSVHSLIIKEILASHTGMILVTGPTGSGKTTSLYAILQELIEKPINIVTIENPVEYRIPWITQVEVNESAGVSFALALRSFLRQDPDVILVGEIRDEETAKIAARAAQTGHLVLSTLHSNNCFEALHRLQSLGVSGDDLSSSLRLLISQRLANKKCTCNNATTCEFCSGSGNFGRFPLQELLVISPLIREKLAHNSKITEIEKIAFAEGFKSLRTQGLELVEQNILDQTELNAICPL
jgi:type II secretory ATPase GspE/PulE/Tfp pilus assembly ATPase PilB-like protein